jgi:hypothetical protein
MYQMQQYVHKMEQNGYVRRETRKLENFEELLLASHHSSSEETPHVIINCSGLGSQILNNDYQLRPTQGHLIHLKDQASSYEMNYLISILPSQKTVTKSGFVNKPSMYYHPKIVDDLGNIGVIGGTFIEGATERQPHEEEFDDMLQRARQFFGQTDNTHPKQTTTIITPKM